MVLYVRKLVVRSPAPKGIPKKFPSGPIVEPRPGPTLAREVAAADSEVIKSS